MVFPSATIELVIFKLALSLNFIGQVDSFTLHLPIYELPSVLIALWKNVDTFFQLPVFNQTFKYATIREFNLGVAMRLIIMKISFHSIMLSF